MSNLIRLQSAAGYSLVTAKIVYRIPDHQDLLQEFIWQQFDIVPEFPVFLKFLQFWEEKIEGPLHSVELADVPLIAKKELQAHVDGSFTVH